MKALLTSFGISNKSIEAEMWRLLGGQRNGVKLLFCTTASNYSGGEMNAWVIEDLLRFRDLGFVIDICDINGIGKERFLPRFEQAEVLFFEGGEPQWLKKCMETSGFLEELPRLLQRKLWVGQSAGSMVLCPRLCNSCHDLFGESVANLPCDGLGLVDFQFIPHLNNSYFPKLLAEHLESAAKKLTSADGKKLYVCDDSGAVSVESSNVKVISEGVVMAREITQT